MRAETSRQHWRQTCQAAAQYSALTRVRGFRIPGTDGRRSLLRASFLTLKCVSIYFFGTLSMHFFYGFLPGLFPWLARPTATRYVLRTLGTQLPLFVQCFGSMGIISTCLIIAHRQSAGFIRSKPFVIAQGVQRQARTQDPLSPPHFLLQRVH